MAGGQAVSLPVLRVISLANIVMNLNYIAKNRVNGLLSCEDGIILRSFVLTQNRRVTDRQTELLQLRQCSV